MCTHAPSDHVPHRFVSPGTAAIRFLALTPLLAALACSEPDPRLMAELVRQGDVFLDPQTREPYSGPVFATFDDQPRLIAQRSSLRDGTYDGPYEAYFKNRQLSSKEIYQHGIKNGPYEWYFENGHLFEKGTYHMGHLDGPYEAYWDNGELYERGTYRHGEFDGPREWYLDGELIERVTYVDGMIEGPYERYELDRSLDLRGNLSAGFPCGTWREGPTTITYPACGSATD